MCWRGAATPIIDPLPNLTSCTDHGKEVLAMCEVLRYLLAAAAPVIDPLQLDNIAAMEHKQWLDSVDNIKGHTQ